MIRHAAIFALSITAAQAQTRGELMLCLSVYVVDGDTLHCRTDNGTVKIRLWGIDAPDFDCRSRIYCTQDRMAAKASREALQRIVSATEVHCRPRGLDRYRRAVARCFANGTDIGCLMIRQGHAVEWMYYSKGTYAGCRP